MKRKTAKELLAESFRELAEKKAIDKITIKDITENCGYSSATFYRQFKDKYDLIAWAYTRDLDDIMDGITSDRESIKKAFSDAACYYRDHREYLSNLLLHTSGYDSFVSNMLEIHDTCLTQLIMKAAELEKLDEKTKMLVRSYVFGTVQLSCEWILGRFNTDAQTLTEVYELSMPATLMPLLFG